jgi:hypothetical protein
MKQILDDCCWLFCGFENFIISFEYSRVGVLDAIIVLRGERTAQLK